MMKIEKNNVVLDLAISAFKKTLKFSCKKYLKKNARSSIVSIVSIVPTKGPHTKFVEGVAFSDLIEV